MITLKLAQQALAKGAEDGPLVQEAIGTAPAPQSVDSQATARHCRSLPHGKSGTAAPEVPLPGRSANARIGSPVVARAFEVLRGRSP